MLLDYFLKEIGPVIYNRAIADARFYFEGRAADLESVCYETESPIGRRNPRNEAQGTEERPRLNQPLSRGAVKLRPWLAGWADDELRAQLVVSQNSAESWDTTGWLRSDNRDYRTLLRKR